MKPAKLLLTYLPAPEPRIITSHDLRYFEPCPCHIRFQVKSYEVGTVPSKCMRCNDTGYIGVQSIVLID